MPSHRQRFCNTNKPGAVYARCPRCGGKFDQQLMRDVENRWICGVCYLINYVWKARKEGE
jgi:ribosomal protein S27AE